LKWRIPFWEKKLKMAETSGDEQITVYVVGGPASTEELEEALDNGFEITHCDGEIELHSALSEAVPDVMVMARETAMEEHLLNKIKQHYKDMPVVVVGSDPEVEYVVECMREGAHDFVTREKVPDRLAETVQTAAEEHRLLMQVNQLVEAYRRRGQFGEMVGISPAIQTVYTIVSNVAATDATVFIYGESGTGKELVAQAIHEHSPRSDGEFVAVNCAAIPKDLLESELFGHEKGAFTGADTKRMGSCERADGGTLFLDEVCEMDPTLQSKLLRFLQDHKFTRVGGTEARVSDTRVISATNRDPLKEVEEGQLRDDLYYRLHVVPIELPPLRDRPEDIPVLAQHYLEKLGDKYNKYFVDFSPEAVDLMLRYDWPGNVRQLINTIERIVVLATTDRITADLFPKKIREKARKKEKPALSVDEALGKVQEALVPGEETDEVLPISEVEKNAILGAIRKCGGDISKAARKLGVSRATIYRKLERYGVR